MKHALVIGGTGMLSNVSLWLVNNNYNVSIIARDRQKMERLISQAFNKSNINPVLIDYSNDFELRNSIQSLIEKYGSIDVVVAWIHSYAKNALNSITQIASNSSRDLKLYHILGSSSNLSEIKKSINIPDNCIYCQVQLGFIVQDETSRWLTNDEIANGVIEALKANKSEPVLIGEIEL